MSRAMTPWPLLNGQCLNTEGSNVWRESTAGPMHTTSCTRNPKGRPGICQLALPRRNEGQRRLRSPLFTCLSQNLPKHLFLAPLPLPLISFNQLGAFCPALAQSPGPAVPVPAVTTGYNQTAGAFPSTNHTAGQQEGVLLWDKLVQPT